MLINRLLLVALAALFAACAGRPVEITASGACTVLQRSGFAGSLSVHTRHIDTPNLATDDPVQRLIDISFIVPPNLRRDLLDAALLRADAFAAAGSACTAGPPGRRTCTVVTPALKQAGYVFSATARAGSTDEQVLGMVQRYWEAVSSCTKASG